jgi:hypothetical protein
MLPPFLVLTGKLFLGSKAFFKYYLSSHPVFGVQEREMALLTEVRIFFIWHNVQI